LAYHPYKYGIYFIFLENCFILKSVKQDTRMAKQRGILFFEGTLGGINFYYRKGVPTARAAGGGFTRKAIKTGAHMVRVRENNSEFAGCSQVNKYFKQAIRPFLLGYKDGTLHSRLMQLFLKIKDNDTVSERGLRKVSHGIASDIGRDLLRHFTFTPKRPNLLACGYDFSWDTLSLSVTGFDAKNAGFPLNSDYMEILLGLVRFDFDTNTYTQVIEAPLVIERNFSGDTFSLTVSSLPDGEGEVFAVARVAFYQVVNGSSYLLPGEAHFSLKLLG
jgi:hypothetical protein